MQLTNKKAVVQYNSKDLSVYKICSEIESMGFTARPKSDSPVSTTIWGEYGPSKPFNYWLLYWKVQRELVLLVKSDILAQLFLILKYKYWI